MQWHEFLLKNDFPRFSEIEKIMAPYQQYHHFHHQKCGYFACQLLQVILDNPKVQIRRNKSDWKLYDTSHPLGHVLLETYRDFPRYKHRKIENREQLQETFAKMLLKMKDEGL